MAQSSVYYKFKSQKDSQRIEFDGTGISVFELKREIIVRSGLGDGTDFDLVVSADEGMKEIYDDDTTIIPRSTTVTARRIPAKAPGRGGAARYVSGKMPVHAKNASRREQLSRPLIKASAVPKSVAQMSSAQTEEEKMMAIFAAQAENLTAREEEMATQQFISKTGHKKVQVPDHDPPQGYVCYRCGEKGHWIQVCPTNNDVTFDNRPRVKRTTGIPRSFLRTVDKATALGQHGDGEDSKTPSGVMINADGEFVIAEPDKAAWEQFQAKAKSGAAAQKNAVEGDKEVQERGLECPLDKRMFIEPMKTPCCEKTYCNDCIITALIESDFVCPACKTEGVLIDDLKADEEATEMMRAFLAEKTQRAKAGSRSPRSDDGLKSPASKKADAGAKTPESDATRIKSPSPSAVKSPCTQNSQVTTTTSVSDKDTPTGDQPSSKKRPAEASAENPKIPKAPKAMQQQQQQQQSMMPMMNGMPGMNGMGMGMNNMALNNMPMMFPGMPMMPNFNSMGMGMPNMNMCMMNPMNPMMNPMMGFPNMNMGGMNGGGAGFGGMTAGSTTGTGWPTGNGMNGGHGANAGINGGGMNIGTGFGNMGQQFPIRNFAPQQQADDEDAYFRKPVNPQRHQNRQRRVRPSDFKEL